VQQILALSNRSAPVVEGSESARESRARDTPASAALAATLTRTPLTIVAIGPAANIATLLTRHPAVKRNIERIVLVAGKPPGRLLHPGKHWWFHFGDFNVSQDVDAIRIVLRSFDALAVGYVANPKLFDCHEKRARIGFSVFLAPFGLGRDLEVTERQTEGVPVSYCSAVAPGFKSMLLDRMAAEAPR
jgi:inosine-uridine nucleoside N-ribohydrolase